MPRRRERHAARPRAQGRPGRRRPGAPRPARHRAAGPAAVDGTRDDRTSRRSDCATTSRSSTAARTCPRDTRITVHGEDGNVRTVVHVDADGKVHVDAIAPNTRHGDNPEVRHPAPNAHYRVELGHRHDVFVADADGTRQTTQDTIKIGDRVVPIDRAVLIEPIPEPANGRQVIDRDHPLAPRPDEAFTARTDLPPNTRIEVHDTDGHVPRHGPDRRATASRGGWPRRTTCRPTRATPRCSTTSQGTNYNIDRGPLLQEFTTDAEGHPQHARRAHRADHDQAGDGHRPQAGRAVQPPGQVHDPSTEYVVTDEHGQRRGRFLTDESGPRGVRGHPLGPAQPGQRRDHPGAVARSGDVRRLLRPRQGREPRADLADARQRRGEAGDAAHQDRRRLRVLGEGRQRRHQRLDAGAARGGRRGRSATPTRSRSAPTCRRAPGSCWTTTRSRATARSRPARAARPRTCTRSGRSART